MQALDAEKAAVEKCAHIRETGSAWHRRALDAAKLASTLGDEAVKWREQAFSAKEELKRATTGLEAADVLAEEQRASLCSVEHERDQLQKQVCVMLCSQA